MTEEFVSVRSHRPRTRRPEGPLVLMLLFCSCTTLGEREPAGSQERTWKVIDRLEAQLATMA